MKSLILKNKTKVVLLILVVVLILKIITLLSFNNVEWEPDSYMHFLELRTIYANFPQNLALGLNVWSKPLYIYPLGLITSIFNIKAFLAIEIINTLIFLLISFLVYKIVLRLYKNFSVAVLALLLTSFSLTLFKSSVSVLTEPIFTLTLVSSFYFLTKKKYLLASLLVGLSVLARIEGLFFMAIYFAYVAYDLKFDSKKLTNILAVIAVPLLSWNLIGFLNTGDPLFFRTFFQSYSSGNYGTGTLLDYPKLFITKEFILSLLFIGAIIGFRKYFKDFENKKLIVYAFSIFSGFVFIQAVLWSRGALGTAGLIRYFISVIPFMIIFGVSVFTIIKTKYSKFFNVSMVTLVVLQVTLTLMYLTGTVVNTKEYPSVDFAFVEAGNWIKDNITSNEFVGADRPEVLYYSQRDLQNSKVYYAGDFSIKRPGYYIWTGWSESSMGISLQDYRDNATLVKDFDSKVIVFQIK